MRNTSGRKVGPEDKTMTLITSRDKTVVVTVQTRAAVPPQHAFKVNVPIDLTLVFKGWGPFPAVRGAENQTGAWDHVGASRRGLAYSLDVRVQATSRSLFACPPRTCSALAPLYAGRH
jgi:hypothetical protein